MTPDIVFMIQQAMADDDDNQSELLITTYNNADDATKQIIDDTLIAICGWGMASLTRRAIHNGYMMGE